jgi:hypothetical protein
MFQLVSITNQDLIVESGSIVIYGLLGVAIPALIVLVIIIVMKTKERKEVQREKDATPTAAPPQAHTAPNAQYNAQPQPTKLCATCGAPLINDDRFCGSCGTRAD